MSYIDYDDAHLDTDLGLDELDVLSRLWREIKPTFHAARRFPAGKVLVYDVAVIELRPELAQH